MSGWHIEAITAHDLDKIVNIDRYAFKRPWQRNLFLAELSSNDTDSYSVKSYRAAETQAIIAYVFLRFIINELHIIRIAVAPQFRQCGVATGLLQYCFRLAKEKQVTSVYIEVRPSNIPAIALYKKLGFQLIGRRPNYYSESSEDALVMEKNVKENP
jgi:ribosomal-protein-alanine N-acetyltransferase